MEKVQVPDARQQTSKETTATTQSAGRGAIATHGRGDLPAAEATATCRKRETAAIISIKKRLGRESCRSG